MGFSFGGSNWWEASSVDREFLKYLVAYMYPHQDEVFNQGERPTKTKYLDEVNQLCHRSGLNCDNIIMNFEEKRT